MCPLIDPLTRLALALEDQPGTHVVLLGSGVSRAAGVPTGWELLLDLMRRIAVAEGEADVTDPAGWWLRTRGRPPAYSEVIEALAPTAEERRVLLARYFEPTPEDRELQRRVPTVAHRAIARLMADGRIRVAVTTNFDRLLEGALEAEGVQPTVVSSEAGAEGLLPLQHVGPLVIKVHGDYLDSPLLNTAEELERYSVPVRELLCRVLTEFGLVVCGWSGESDVALGNCILESTRHRFGTFWMSMGDPATAAAKLITHRRASLIQIEDADQAWSAVENKVQAIRDASRPPPLTVELAVAEAKRLVAEPRHRVRLFDLMSSEAELLAKRSGSICARPWPRERDEWIAAANAHVTAADRASFVGAVVAFHGDPSTDQPLIEMVRLAWSLDWRRTEDRDLTRLGPAWVTHMTCVAAIASGRWALLKRVLLDTLIRQHHGPDVPLVKLFPLHFVLVRGHEDHLVPPPADGSRYRVPFSEWALSRGKATLRHSLRSDELIERSWELLDWIVALLSVNRGPHIPLGRYVYREDAAVSEAAMRLVASQTGTELGNLLLSEKFMAANQTLGEAHRVVKERTAQLRW